MTDPRKQLVTVTMTAEEWDSLATFDRFEDTRLTTYASDLHGGATRKIAQAVGSPAERRALAETEAIARRPVLDRKTKRALSRDLAELLRKHQAGTLDVDHLGRGEDTPPDRNGFYVTLIPHTASGQPAIHFEIESVWFERHQLEMLPEDHAWCVKIVGRYRKVIDHWNDSGPWVNVRFGP